MNQIEPLMELINNQVTKLSRKNHEQIFQEFILFILSIHLPHSSNLSQPKNIMAFCLCQRFNIKKDGNTTFVEIFHKHGFKFSWKYLSTTKCDGKSYALYQFDISDVSDAIELEHVSYKTGNGKSTIDVFPGKMFAIQFPENDPKLVTLKVLWNFKYGTNETLSNGSSIFRQHLKIKKNGNIFTELIDGCGFTFSWEKEGKLKCLGKRQYQLYQFKISKMNNGLQFDDIQITYQSATLNMFPGKNFVVGIFENESKTIEFNVVWSVIGENFKVKLVADISTLNMQSTALVPSLPNDFNESSKHSGPEKKLQPLTTTIVSKPQVQATAAKEPISKVGHENENELNSPLSILTDAFTSKKYADVIFLTNDAKKVFAHRCILFSFSDIFTALFDQSLDAQIEIEVDFPEATVTRAIEFCYGKNDGIQNFEDGLIKFADKYAIKGLKKACLKSLKDQQLTLENVCKIVEIAFEQNYTLLKQKCLHFIAQNKAIIGAEKLSKLPVEILVSAFLSA